MGTNGKEEFVIGFLESQGYTSGHDPTSIIIALDLYEGLQEPVIDSQKPDFDFQPITRDIAFVSQRCLRVFIQASTIVFGIGFILCVGPRSVFGASEPKMRAPTSQTMTTEQIPELQTKTENVPKPPKTPSSFSKNRSGNKT